MGKGFSALSSIVYSGIFDSLASRITKLTARYHRKYKMALQPAFQWEEENCREAVEI